MNYIVVGHCPIWHIPEPDGCGILNKLSAQVWFIFIFSWKHMEEFSNCENWTFLDFYRLIFYIPWKTLAWHEQRCYAQIEIHTGKLALSMTAVILNKSPPNIYTLQSGFLWDYRDQEISSQMCALCGLHIYTYDRCKPTQFGASSNIIKTVLQKYTEMMCKVTTNICNILIKRERGQWNSDLSTISRDVMCWEFYRMWWHWLHIKCRMNFDE